MADFYHKCSDSRSCRIIIAILVLTCFARRANAAQTVVWCGFSLIQGLTLDQDDLSSLQPFIQQASDYPQDLFQSRFSLDSQSVIIEACWYAPPTESLIANLLSGAIDQDADTILSDITFATFAYGEDHDTSANIARGYLAANLSAWEVAAS